MPPELRPPDPPPVRLVLGVPLHDVTLDEAVAWAVARARSGGRTAGHVVTSNLDFARLAARDPEMRRIHVEADLVVPDGMPAVWLSRLVGPRLRERVAGSDLVPRLAEAARDHGLSVFAVGGAPGVAETALRRLQERFPGLKVAGSASPPVAPLASMDDADVLERIRLARPDLLLVAFGAPKQEKWIRLHREALPPALAIGVGGSLDFIAGTQSRAPRWAQRAGLEWLWRLAGQPRRLFKRYLLDAVFLIDFLVRLVLLRLSPAAPVRRADGLPPGRDAVDLSDRRWMDSAELGGLAERARRRRRAGGRLAVSACRGRVERLLRLHGLDRVLDLPGAAERPAGAAALRRSAGRLLLTLPEVFGEGAAADARAALEAADDGVSEIVIDASRLAEIDTAGLRFLRHAHEASRLWLRGAGGAMRRRLAREGLGGLREDRRRGVRLADEAEPSPAEPHKEVAHGR